MWNGERMPLSGLWPRRVGEHTALYVTTNGCLAAAGRRKVPTAVAYMNWHATFFHIIPFSQHVIFKVSHFPQQSTIIHRLCTAFARKNTLKSTLGTLSGLVEKKLTHFFL
jgi:hypothetical protein